MQYLVLGNIYTDEATVNGTVDITFPYRSRQLVIINDSSSNNLTVTIGSNTLTLKPTETASLHIWVTGVTLAGTSVPYRVWAIG